MQSCIVHTKSKICETALGSSYFTEDMHGIFWNISHLFEASQILNILRGGFCGLFFSEQETIWLQSILVGYLKMGCNQR